MAAKSKPAGGKKKKCGIVMPISGVDGCTAEHWADVLAILKSSIDSTDFEPNLVSDADDIGIIQKRIIQNLYHNEMVVCDVSGKNPNVMFELGLRLAFDKPTIIVKDDKTDYSFDTAIIEHLTYPRDLRFGKIVEFKRSLATKISATFKKAKEDPNHSTFLKSFGDYRVAELQEREVSSQEFLISSLEEIKSEIQSLKLRQELGEPMRFKRTRNTANRVVVRRLLNFLKERALPIQALKDGQIRKAAYDFVEQTEEVRRMCGSPKVVQEVFDTAVDGLFDESPN
ncbi:MAG: RNA helicase [Verrucomicrobia bacterium]|nr:MAG: RNA helicase [Verrucomicrobiota bacterium]